MEYGFFLFTQIPLLLIIKNNGTNKSLLNKMNTHVPDSIRLKEKRDAILRAQEVAAALTSENVLCYLHWNDLNRTNNRIEMNM